MALILSSPPLALSDEALAGADVEREGRRIDPVEPDARAVGGDGEDFGAVAAVDLGGIGAVAALEQVGIVAGVPDHAVVAGLAEHLVVAVAAAQHIVAVASVQQIGAAFAEEDIVADVAEELVGPRAARHGIVARAAEQIGGRQRAAGFIECDDVVAGLPEDLDQAGVGDRGCAPQDRHRAAVDAYVPGCVAAGRYRVAEIVAVDCQLAGGGGKTGGDRHRANLLLRIAGNSDMVTFSQNLPIIRPAGKGRELVKRPRRGAARVAPPPA